MLDLTLILAIVTFSFESTREIKSEVHSQEKIELHSQDCIEQLANFVFAASEEGPGLAVLQLEDSTLQGQQPKPILHRFNDRFKQILSLNDQSEISLDRENDEYASLQLMTEQLMSRLVHKTKIGHSKCSFNLDTLIRRKVAQLGLKKLPGEERDKVLKVLSQELLKADFVADRAGLMRRSRTERVTKGELKIQVRVKVISIEHLLFLVQMTEVDEQRVFLKAGPAGNHG